MNRLKTLLCALTVSACSVTLYAYSGSPGAASSVSITDSAGVSISSNNPQHVSLGQTVSGTNTYTASSNLITGTAVYTGGWENTRSLGYVRQLIVLAGDTVAITSGLGGTFTFEYGEDGATALISESRTIDDFTTVRDFDLLNAGEYFRTKFQPDREMTNESIFVTTTHRRQFDGHFVRLGGQPIEFQNAALPHSFVYLQGFKDDGKSVAQSFTDQGNPITADFLTQVAIGNVDKHRLVHIFARNDDVDTGSTPETIWNGGGLYPWASITTGSVLRVVSDNALDSNTLAGARTVRIEGINDSQRVSQEDVTLQGTVFAETTGKFLRVNSATVLTSGGINGNFGTISATQTVGGALMFSIGPSNAVSSVGIFSTASNETAYIYMSLLEVAESASVFVEANLRSRESGMPFVLRDRLSADSAATLGGHDYPAPLVVQRNSDVDLRAASTTANNTEVLGGMDILVVTD